jgi:hypothetical protein
MLNLTQFRAALDPALLPDFEAILAIKNTAINNALAAQELAVTQTKLDIQANLDGLVQAAKSASAARDWAAIDAVLAQALGYTTAARRVRLEAEITAAQTAVTEAAKQLAALD